MSRELSPSSVDAKLQSDAVLCDSALNLEPRCRLFAAGAASSSLPRLLPRRNARVTGPEGAPAAPAAALLLASLPVPTPAALLPAAAAASLLALRTAAATAPRRLVLPCLKLLTCRLQGAAHE